MLYVVCFVVFVSILIASIISIYRLRNIKNKSSDTSHEDMYKETKSADLSDISDVEQSLAQKKIQKGELPNWNDLTDKEKTKLSVWSEKGGPLEDLHLLD